MRKDTLFLIKIMVDVSTGAKFPPQSVISAALVTAGKINAAMSAGDIAKLEASIEEGHKTIDEAVAAMSMYRDNFYVGGEQLVKELGQIKDGCKDTLTILAAIATGGSSIAVTAGVMAAVGSYGELLDQIDKASVKKVEPLEAFGDVIKAGVIAGAVGALTAEGGLVDEFAGKLGAKVGAKVLEICGKQGAEELVKIAIKNMLKEDFADLIETIVKAFKPGSKKMTLSDFADEMAKNALKNAAFGFLLGGMDNELKGLTSNWAKGLKGADFKGLGKVDIEKALKGGAEKYLNEALKRVAQDVFKDAAGDKGKSKKVGDSLVTAMQTDSKLNAALAKLVKDKKLDE